MSRSERSERRAAPATAFTNPGAQGASVIPLLDDVPHTFGKPNDFDPPPRVSSARAATARGRSVRVRNSLERRLPFNSFQVVAVRVTTPRGACPSNVLGFTTCGAERSGAEHVAERSGAQGRVAAAA